MSEDVYPVSADWAKRAYVDNEAYLDMYRRSVDDPAAFWREHGRRIDWIKPFSKVKNTSYDPHNVSIKWFEDGTLNVSANCVDRHLDTRGDQTAIIWEGDDPAEHQHITYRELHHHVNKMANVFHAMGVRKGDRGDDLSADDSRGGLCDARLRADRRRPFDRVRRVFARQPGAAHFRLRLQDRHHRR